MIPQTLTPGIRPGGAPTDWFQTAATDLVLGIACYVAQRVSVILRFPPGGISTIWLAGGILLEAHLAVSTRRWCADLAR